MSYEQDHHLTSQIVDGEVMVSIADVVAWLRAAATMWQHGYPHQAAGATKLADSLVEQWMIATLPMTEEGP